MLYQQIRNNKIKTFGVMFFFMLLVTCVGAAVGYIFMGSTRGGILLAVILGLVYMFVMMGQSTAVVMQMNNAQPITDASQAPELWHTVEDMALVGQVPMPAVYIIHDPSPNAFATGPDPEHAAVAATTGLLDRLNREELEGVIAHEISHIKNYDIRLQTTAVVLTAVVSALINLGMNSFIWGGGRRRDDREESNPLDIVMLILALLAVVLAPLAATLTQLALSRNREYLADASAVVLTRNPYGLISALEKISNSQPMRAANVGSASLYIADPFKQRSWSQLFATHPPVADRIARLEKM